MAGTRRWKQPTASRISYQSEIDSAARTLREGGFLSWLDSEGLQVADFVIEQGISDEEPGSAKIEDRESHFGEPTRLSTVSQVERLKLLPRAL